MNGYKISFIPKARKRPSGSGTRSYRFDLYTIRVEKGANIELENIEPIKPIYLSFEYVSSIQFQ